MSTSRGGGRKSGKGQKGKNRKSNSGNSSDRVIGEASIPEGFKEIVQRLKEAVNRPEDEIYAMLKKCNMNPDEAAERFLDQEASTKPCEIQWDSGGSTEMTTSRGGGRKSGKGRKRENSKNNSGNSTDRVVEEASIPEEFKEIVQCLNEAVNCPEDEIYAMLKECNMNPNEAADRLLAQGQFQEVKSKREKKKEAKDAQDSKSHGASISGGKGGVDQFTGCGAMNQSASSVYGADKVVQEDSYGGTSAFDDDLHENAKTFEVGSEAFDQQEDEQITEVLLCEDIDISVSSLATDLQQVNMEREDGDSGSETGSPAVKIPEHLRVEAAACSNLCLGSFGPGMRTESGVDEIVVAATAACSQLCSQEPNMEREDGDSGLETGSPGVKIPEHLRVEATACSHLCLGSFGPGMRTESGVDDSVEVEAPSVSNTDARNPDYNGDDHLQTTLRVALRPGNHDLSSTPEEAPESVLDRYNLPDSPFHRYEPEDDTRGLNPSPAPCQTRHRMQNLSYLPSVQSVRESEVPPPNSEFTSPRSWRMRLSSISTEPTSSLTRNLSAAHQTQTGGSIWDVSPQQRQQHLSQPSLPSGRIVNAVDGIIPISPQSHAPYIPPASHQSLPTIPPPLQKDRVSVDSFPQPAVVAPPPPSPVTPIRTPMGYDDHVIVNSSYQEPNQLLSLQRGPGSRTTGYDGFQGQSQQPAGTQQGPGSRTMTAVPSGTGYYDIQGQSQQPAGTREGRGSRTMTTVHGQSQLMSQHYGNPGYLNLSHSQSGRLSEHRQQQPSRGGARRGSEERPRLRRAGAQNYSQQFWRNNY